ncbi:uncharacterized protein A1O5_03823 [Cladophialophora psammophila CBS 110553]|uniref:NB-ARC domain-containing protein n=1 Tax=Cladophialophora psammophila CBS 110553 TaxID=1182543 RepID=W9WWT8_9EURO|nr:uncharacterized protein A1O5_03823 [Cladophialophora psammophila CBS 110553]EXJ72677.1 hypothetical protein A1O5_03823 [Cladophialophora psammophila CBS 110553]
MDRKSPSHDTSLLDGTHSLAPPSQSQEDPYNPPTIDQSHDVALVIRVLNQSYNCHGVYHSKILLWGSAGCGKRRIATEAALQFSARTGCKILWIDGRSFECFIRDYRAAYTIITGENLPQGLTLTHTLLKIKSTLEARRDESLIVVFDLQFYLEEDVETALSTPDLFLPDRCRILFTSSYVIPSECVSGNRGSSVTCGLKLARRAICLYVGGLNEEQGMQYFRASVPNSNDAVDSLRAFGHRDSWQTTPLRLALSCACMRLLQVSPKHFHRLCAHKAREGCSPSWPGYSPIFSDIMCILWDALNDYDIAAGRLLAICSIVDRVAIPVSLVEKFPIFQNNRERLLSAIDVLRLSGLVEIHRGAGLDTINLHLQVQRWLQLKRRRIEDKQELTDLVHAWVSVLSDYLTKPKDELPKNDPIFDAEKFWRMLAHVTSLCSLKSRQTRELCSMQYMAFLKHVAIFLVEDGFFVGMAWAAVTHALSMCTLLQSRQVHNLELDREYVHIRQVKANAYMNMSEYGQAEIELREAKRVLSRRLSGSADSTQTLREIQDTEAYLSVVQGKWAEAGRMLTELLAYPEPNAEPSKVAQRHYWMAKTKAAVGTDISALAHSQ